MIMKDRMKRFIQRMAEAKRYSDEIDRDAIDHDDAEQFCDSMIDEAREIMAMDTSVNGYPNGETWEFDMNLDSDHVMQVLDTTINTLIGDNDWNDRDNLHSIKFNARCDLIEYLTSTAGAAGYSCEEIDMIHIADLYMDSVHFYEAGYDYTSNVSTWEKRMFTDFGMARDWIANIYEDAELGDFELGFHPQPYEAEAGNYTFWIRECTNDKIYSD